MGFWDDLLNIVPSDAASNAKAAVDQTAGNLRSSNGRFDPTVIDAKLPKVLTDNGFGDDVDLQTALANMRADQIDRYKAPSQTPMQWFGKALRAASVPVAYAQGNSGYGAAMQQQLDKEMNDTTEFDRERAKMGLENADTMLSNIGTTGTSILAQRRQEKQQYRQALAQAVQQAALFAHDRGLDPHQAQAEAIRRVTPQIRAAGHPDVADAFEKAYPLTPTAPVSAQPTPPPGGAPAPVPGQSGPTAGLPPQGVQVASAGTPPLPQGGTPPGPAMPDFAGGLRVAAGGPADASQLSAPDVGPAPDVATPAAAPAPAPQRDPVQDLYDQADEHAMAGDEEGAKRRMEQAKTVAGAIKVEKYQDEAGNEFPIYTDSRHPDAPARRIQVEGGPQGQGSDFGDFAKTGEDYLKSVPEGAFKARVQNIINGDSSPPSQNSRNKYNNLINKAVMAADPNFSMYDADARHKFVLDNAQGKRNDQRQTLGTFAFHIGAALKTAEKLPNGQIPAWNAATNEFNNATGDPRVGNFNTEIHAVQGEAGKLFRAGVVTDKEMGDLQANLSASKSPAQIRGVLDSFKTLVEGRVSSLDAAGRMVMQRGWRPEKHSIITPETQKQLDAYEADPWGRPMPTAASKDDAAKMPLNKPFNFNGHTLKRVGDGKFERVG